MDDAHYPRRDDWSIRLQRARRNFLHISRFVSGLMDPYTPFLFHDIQPHNSPSGTSIKIYGKVAGALTSYLDGNITTPIVFAKTTPDDWVSSIYHFYDIQDGDHQLQGVVEQSTDYFHLSYVK